VVGCDRILLGCNILSLGLAEFVVRLLQISGGSLQRPAGATTSPRFTLNTILDVYYQSDCDCCSRTGVPFNIYYIEVWHPQKFKSRSATVPDIRVINPLDRQKSLYDLNESSVVSRNDSYIYEDTLDVTKSGIGETHIS